MITPITAAVIMGGLTCFGSTSWDFTPVPLIGSHLQAIAAARQMRQYNQHYYQVHALASHVYQSVPWPSQGLNHQPMLSEESTWTNTVSSTAGTALTALVGAWAGHRHMLRQ